MHVSHDFTCGCNVMGFFPKPIYIFMYKHVFGYGHGCVHVDQKSMQIFSYMVCLKMCIHMSLRTQAHIQVHSHLTYGIALEVCTYVFTEIHILYIVCACFFALYNISPRIVTHRQSIAMGLSSCHTLLRAQRHSCHSFQALLSKSVHLGSHC